MKQIPVVLQSEASECGLAALCMVAGYHGHELNIIRARQRFNISMNGCTAADLTQMAASIGLQARAYTLDLDEVSRLQTPAILHWGMNHFVVLGKCRQRGYDIYDPARGKRLIDHVEFSRKFTGVAIEFERRPDFSKQRSRERPRIRQLLGSLSGITRVVGELFALSLVLQLVTLATPYVFQLVVDDVLVNLNEPLLLAVCLGLAFLAAFQATTEAVRGWCATVVGSRLAQQLTTNVMSHLMRLPLPYFERRHVGDILMRFNSVQALQEVLTSTAVSILIDGLVVALTLSAMLLYDQTLAAIVIGCAATILGLRLGLFSYQRRLQEAVIAEEAKEQTHTIESVRSVHSLRTAGGEPFRVQQWGSTFSRVVNARLSVARFGIQMDTVEQLVEGLQHVLVIYLAASSILSGDLGMTVGMLFAFLAYKARFSSHAMSLVDGIVRIRLLDLHLQRLADILWQTPEVARSTVQRTLAPEGDIEAKGLMFRYAANDPAIFSNLDLHIPEGQMVAIVGPSGAGKTTLLKVLIGLYWPTSGELRVGGQVLDRSNAPSWRQRLGVVLQEDALVSGTIADNIAYMRDDLDMDRVAAAAAMAGVAEEIATQPMGYLSMVGDLGSALSSGQKQRLLIARALYREPSVLVLDEGTANLDPENEARLADLIATLPMTRIVVAHRPALVARADIVLSLEGGQLSVVANRREPTGAPLDRVRASP